MTKSKLKTENELWKNWLPKIFFTTIDFCTWFDPKYIARLCPMHSLVIKGHNNKLWDFTEKVRAYRADIDLGENCIAQNILKDSS